VVFCNFHSPLVRDASALNIPLEAAFGLRFY
jgi:hypothetical protein